MLENCQEASNVVHQEEKKKLNVIQENLLSGNDPDSVPL